MNKLEIIKFEDFAKLDIRIGTIEEAEHVEGSDKLLKLVVDLGEEKRQVVAGIGKVYEPKELLGKQIPILANLEPRLFMGLESQGMILAADENGRPVLLNPDKQVNSGANVR